MSGSARSAGRPFMSKTRATASARQRIHREAVQRIGRQRDDAAGEDHARRLLDRSGRGAQTKRGAQSANMHHHPG